MHYSSKRYNSQPNQIHLSERPLSYSKHWWTMSWVKDNQINWVLKISCSSHKILNFYSTNISLSQSHSLKVSALVLSSTQSRIVSLYKIFCSWMKSLFWSYPLPRTEQDLFTKSHHSHPSHIVEMLDPSLSQSMVQGSHHLIWDCPWVQGSHHLIWGCPWSCCLFSFSGQSPDLWGP